jgi:hypothetical protein
VVLVVAGLEAAGLVEMETHYQHLHHKVITVAQVIMMERRFLVVAAVEAQLLLAQHLLILLHKQVPGVTVQHHLFLAHL